MRRRDFLTAAAVVACGLPLGVRAQQPARLTIGFLHSATPQRTAKRLNAFLKGLNDAGFVEGKNVEIEYRWADGQNDKLSAMAADLVQKNVTVITTAGSTPAAVVAKAATSSIPIVFGTGGDPVAMGLVASLNRPGGNITGVTSTNVGSTSKRLALIHQLVPSAQRYFALVNPGSALTEPFLKDLAASAPMLQIRYDVLRATNEQEINRSFAALPPGPGNVLVSCPDAYLYSQRAQIAGLAAHFGVPTAFDVRDYVEDGGLLSYGTDYLNVMELAGGYVGRVLRGEKPADLPVVQSDKFELVINLKTAKALGLAVPPTFLALTDEVIE
jgi:putative tryptophan/tyrosine transport system substrate-binding protein